jgi:hypothetical protein
MVNSKHAFWQALIVAIAVFGIGITAGFFIESYRADSVKLNILDSEIRVLDEQIRERVLERGNVSCALSEKSLLAFADRIYGEAQKLEQYHGASKFSESFLILHRRYDLLRALLWQDSINHRVRCPSSFHNVVYLYEYGTDSVESRARQSYYSRMLAEIKTRAGNEILLIPLATNMNLSSVDILLENYDVTETPAILIDERYAVTTVITRDELERIIFFNRTLE